MRQKCLALCGRLSRSELALSLCVALVVIIAGTAIGYENNKVVPVNPSLSAHYTLEPHATLSFMSDWDGPIYLGIAAHGYTNKIQANFFPLYPLLIRAVNTFVRSVLYSGLLVSWACLVGAIYYYLKIIKQFYGLADNLEALRGVLFFVLFPTAVFLIATYTESLFAFLALGSIYYALRKNWAAAGIFAMLSTATHVNGLFVVATIGLLLWEEQVKLVKIAAAMAIGSLGLISYMTYQKIVFGNPLAFLAAQKKHSWFNFSPAHVLSEFATLNGIFLVLMLLAVVYWWPKKKSFSIYSLLYVCIVFLGGRDLSGIGRYALMAFPLQFMLYDHLRDKKLGYLAAVSLTSIVWTFFTLRYAGGYTGG